MINIKSKEYDLTSLFRYDLLRDILLSLAESQNDLRSEIEALKNQNKYYDVRLSQLEEKNEIKINPSQFNINITNVKQPKTVENINNQENQQNDENDDKEEEEENKKDEENNNKKDEENNDKKDEENNDKKDDQNNDKKDDESNDKKEDIKENETKEDKKKENKIKNNVTSEEDEEERKSKSKRRKKLSVKYPNLIDDSFIANFALANNLQSQKNTELNLELIGNMLKSIRENSEKIANIEGEIKNKVEKQIKKETAQFQKDMRNGLLEISSKCTANDNRINEISQKAADHDKLIDDLTVKSTNFDIFKVFQDSGDGSVDMAKILVKSLEERVFKKFEIYDLRYKQESGEIIKNRKTMENLNSMAEKNNRDINDLKESEQKIKEDIDNLKNLIETNDNKYLEMIEEKENNYNTALEDLKNELDKKIIDIEEILNDKLMNVKTNRSKKENSKDEINDEQNKYDEEIINTLERKFGDLRKKTNDLDNSFKLFLKDFDVDEIKKNIKDLKFELEQKLTKESLKELYNLHLSDVDEIGDLRNLYSTAHDEAKKNSKNITTLTNKMELVLGNLISLKKNKDGPQKLDLDLSKYVENDIYNEMLKKFNRKFEKTFEELDSLRRDLSEIQMNYKDFEKKERINRLEEEIFIQINERKTNCTKNKNDLLKQIKTLEVQVKALNEEMKQKQDADSWILAKQPMKCFNCATCEAHIKNETPSEEFISWNKYPLQNKLDNNRFGRGFSHMLQMMTSDLINNVDNPNFLNNKEQANKEDANPRNNLMNSTNNIHSINNNNDNYRMNYMAKIATIERNPINLINKNNKKETGKSSVPKNSGKLKLPKMFDGINKMKGGDSTANLDEEKNNMNGNDDPVNSNDNINISPRIIKITKKHGNNNMININQNSPPKIIKPPSSKNRNSKVITSDDNQNFSKTVAFD